MVSGQVFLCTSLKFRLCNSSKSYDFLTGTTYISIAWFVDLPVFLAMSGLGAYVGESVMSATTPFLMAFALYKFAMPLRLAISGALTPTFASMTRENSRVARVLGDIFDRNPVLRDLRDDKWPKFVDLSFPFEFEEKSKENGEKSKDKEDTGSK